MMDIDPPRDADDGSSRPVSPSVSREKWLAHAQEKLRKGYVLVVSRERKAANFFMRGKGFEPCAYQSARALIAQGFVVPSGKHSLGDMYTLAENAPAPPKQS